MFVLIVIIKKLIIILDIKWYCINIRINRYKTASRFIVNNKVIFNKLKQISTYRLMLYAL